MGCFFSVGSLGSEGSLALSRESLGGHSLVKGVFIQRLLRGDFQKHHSRLKGTRAILSHSRYGIHRLGNAA